MEPVDGGWQNEMREYIRSVGDRTAIALKRIKQDRIRNNLPFDDAFQKYFLQKTNARIAYVYADFLFDENLEGGQGPSNQDMNQRNYGNGSAPFAQNENVEMSEQIAISVPSNPLPIQLQMDFGENPEQVSRKSGGNEQLVASNPNENADTVKQIAIGGGGLAIESISTSTSVGCLECNKPLERMVASNIHQPDTIDLTTHQGEANGVLAGAQKDNATLNMQLLGKCPTKVNKNDAHMKNQIAASNTQRMKKDGPNIGKELNHTQHSDDDDNLELVARNGVAAVSNGNTNDNHQFGPIALSEIKTEFNFPETTISTSCAVGHGDVNHRNDVAVAAESIQSLQYPELIDLISDDGDAERKVVNNFSKEAQNGAQSTTQVRKRKNENTIPNGLLKKKSKLSTASDTKKRLKCDFCEYSTDFKTHLNHHIRTHTNERPFQCEVCEKKFTQRPHLNRHMKTHRDLFAFQCLNCRQGFSHEIKWKLHESRCKSKQFECFLCSRKFEQKCHLLRHMRHKHTGEKPFGCCYCRKRFVQKNDLTRHTNSHR